jgi:hypothetical protein
MPDKHGKDETDMLCSCGELHKGHLCWLSHMGLLNEVYHLTNTPTVLCSKCRAKANLSHNVCFPVPLLNNEELAQRPKLVLHK